MVIDHQPSNPKLDKSETIVSTIEKTLISGSVTIVIPALNEAGNLPRLLSWLEETFQNLGYELPVLVINDGSTDETPKILENLQLKYPFLQVFHHESRQGVTQVWKTALTQIQTDWLFWGQGDLESDPRVDIPTLLNAATTGVDAIAGWRQNRGDGKTSSSQLANKACQLAFGMTIHDMNWIKLIRRDALVDLPLELITHRYLLAVLSAMGYRVIEVATPWYPRFSGVSKFGYGRLVTSSLDFFRVLVWFYLHLAKKKLFFRRKNSYLTPNT
ncbi:MAG: glycosyltransferase family 2 protein [Symploca sp. SIO1A3]|nr:glycosyltransferase family 2 protein [Symploca sp. SIO1A3]